MKKQKQMYQFYYRLSQYGEQINEYKRECIYPRKTKQFKDLMQRLDNHKIYVFGYYQI